MANASGATPFWESALLNWLFRSQSLTQPTQIYVGLLTTTPDPVSHTSGIEVTATGYARVDVAAGTGNFAAPSGGSVANTPSQTSNNSAINFGTWTTGPTTVLGWSIYDALTAGNLLYFATLSSSVTVNAGDAFQIGVNGLTITLL